MKIHVRLSSLLGDLEVRRIDNPPVDYRTVPPPPGMWDKVYQEIHIRGGVSCAGFEMEI